MHWFSAFRLFDTGVNSESSMSTTSSSEPYVLGVTYHGPHPLRKVPVKVPNVKAWRSDGPYRISPLPIVPIPPTVARVPMPKYLHKNVGAWK